VHSTERDALAPGLEARAVRVQAHRLQRIAAGLLLSECHLKRLPLRKPDRDTPDRWVAVKPAYGNDALTDNPRTARGDHRPVGCPQGLGQPRERDQGSSAPRVAHIPTGATTDTSVKKNRPKHSQVIRHARLSLLRQWHGWTIARYREAFRLFKREPTCARGVSEKLRVHTKARLASGELAPVTPYRKAVGTGGRGVRRARSLGVRRPDLVPELHPDLNDELDVFSVGVKSGRSLWWRCRDCGCEWRAAPHDRSRGGGCPRCAQRRRNDANRVARHERSLAVKRPNLLAELHRR
jgi:hypothetical protein